MFGSIITIWLPVHKFETMHSSLFLIFCLAISISLTSGEQLILANNCNESVWPGILGNSGHQTPMGGGFHLGRGKHVVVEVPKKWSGRIWGRQGCSFSREGKGSCDSGDCSGRLHCRGTAGVPPATIVEVTLGSSISPMHYYDVSLVDGFNLPLSMKPIGGGIGCGIASCDIDVNIFCPSALEVKKNGKVVGCKSACLAMQSAKYCCTGKYANPKTCRPTLFAHLFKAMCPKAYTYAFDDPSSLRKCKVSRYAITFCPSM
ncbi:thaumatin-like protein [Cucurbita moschata]|uniref:Thaumatin-like protein n=1 Tax=Cucurbita moschata TaxID=3662 RepID=A0A6J1F5Y8_CUCMO|nr:thaumatin-like protein [Cucurbita moschata]